MRISSLVSDDIDFWVKNLTTYELGLSQDL